MSLIIPVSQTLVAGEQIIAPSSNDWDYTFADDEWPVAGNALGDHTLGTYVNPTGGNSAIYSLPTFDGDFEVEFTLGAAFTDIVFGVHALTDDDHRTNSGSAGMDAMTNSFWFDEEQNDFFIGNTDEVNDAYTWDSGDVVKITRESGTIKMWDNDSLVMTFGTTYSGSMRFALCADTSGGTVDVEDLKFTDSEKVQRDGFFNEGGASSNSQGDANTYRETGFLFTATRSGTVTGVKWHVASFGNSYTAHTEIWGHDGTNPTSQIGSDSDTVNLNSTGDKQFTLTDPVVEKGKQYWAICFDDELNGSGDVAFSKVADLGATFGSGRHDTPTSITDNVTDDWKCEIEIDTSAGEPTPDHNTLLLIHSDTTDASTTFVDSSPYGRTITVVGNAQHDTAQKKFGASSILFDASGDKLSVPDDIIWKPEKVDFTIDLWVRFASVGAKQAIINQMSAVGNANTNFYLQLDSGDKLEAAIGQNGGAGTTNVRSTTSMLVDTWYHIAVVKIGGVGQDDGTMHMIVNGTIEETDTGDMQGTNVSTTLDIGTSNDAYVPDFDGWMDEIRISNVARWDADFTRPTSPYPTA